MEQELIQLNLTKIPEVSRENAIVGKLRGLEKDGSKFRYTINGDIATFDEIKPGRSTCPKCSQITTNYICISINSSHPSPYSALCLECYREYKKDEVVVIEDEVVDTDKVIKYLTEKVIEQQIEIERLKT
jgi:hypothetical protein